MDKYKQFEIKSSENDAIDFYHENPVTFYNEDDLLKDITITDLLGNEDNSLTMEHYNAFNIIGEHLLGYCYNSLPPFARKEKYEEGCDNFLNNLHEDLSILQKDNNGVRPFEIECPKIAWGFTAFLITNSIIDTKGRLRVKIRGQEKTLIFLEEQYLKSQKENYYNLNKDDYKYYSINSCNDDIRELDTLFIKQHIELERNLLERTKKGSNSDIIGAYLNYSERYIEFIGNKDKDVNSKQEVVSDSISNKNESTGLPNSEIVTSTNKRAKERNNLENKDPKGEVQTAINIKELKRFFKVSFIEKKVSDDNESYFDFLVRDLQEEWNAKDFARIALLIYESEKRNTQIVPTVFSKWYENFCKIINCKFNANYKPSKLKGKELDNLKTRLYFL